MCDKMIMATKKEIHSRSRNLNAYVVEVDYGKNIVFEIIEKNRYIVPSRLSLSVNYCNFGCCNVSSPSTSRGITF